MRIGIEAQRIFRSKRHGMDMVAVELIRHLQQLDSENEYFIFVNQVEDDSCIEETPNFKIVRLPESPYPVWEQWHLPRAAKAFNLDILHCTSNTAPIWGRVPLIVTVHDIIYLEKINLSKGTWYQRLGNLYRRWNVPSAVKRAQYVLTVSDYEKNRIDNHFPHKPKERIQVIHNGVSPHFAPVPYSIQLEKKLQFGLPQQYILFLGNTDPKKNLEGLLRSLVILDNKDKLSVPVVMPDFGEEELVNMLKKVGGTGLREKIHLTGYIPNQDLPAIYAGALFFLYPSLRESFGLPILEAMASGCPVITSNTSSMPEIAGDAAWLVDPTDPADIAKAIETVLEDEPLRNELIRKGYLRPPLFSYAEGAKKILNLYLFFPSIS